MLKRVERGLAGAYAAITIAIITSARELSLFRPPEEQARQAEDVHLILQRVRVADEVDRRFALLDKSWMSNAEMEWVLHELHLRVAWELTDQISGPLPTPIYGLAG